MTVMQSAGVGDAWRVLSLCLIGRFGRDLVVCLGIVNRTLVLVGITIGRGNEKSLYALVVTLIYHWCQCIIVLLVHLPYILEPMI